MQTLRETHDDLLQHYLKIKSGEMSKHDFIAKALGTGLIDRVEEIFQNAISNSPKPDPEWNWKPHWGMIETLLRAVKTPLLHSIGTPSNPIQLDLKSFDVSEACIDHLYYGSGKGSEVVTYVSEILTHGAISFPSPSSGEELMSNKGFTFYLDAKPFIFYVLNDKFPAILFVNPNIGNIIALYLPHRNIIIGHDYNYEKPIARLKIQILKYSNQVKKYLSSKSVTKPVLLSSFMQHTGHTLLNELPGFDRILEKRGKVARLPVLVGPHEFFPISAVFHEFRRKNVSKFDLSQSDLFLYCLERSFLPVRPMMRHYYISEGFRARLRKVSMRDTFNHQSSILSRFSVQAYERGKSIFDKILNKNLHKPTVIWIEVRNNHRIWLNQVDAIKTLITNLKEHYSGISIFIAGWSLPSDPTADDNVQIANDMKTYQELADFAAGRLEVICGVGLSSEEKLRWAFRCKASVVSFGSGMTLPCLVANLPSIVHANSFYTQRPAMNPDIDQRQIFAENLKPYIVIPVEHITDDPSEPRYQVRNYSVSGDVTFDALRNILDS